MYETPDLTLYQLVHDAMRTGARQLADALDSLDMADRSRAQALRWWCDGFIGELHAHHTVEDELFFPALAARVPSFAQELDPTLGAEHVVDSIMTALQEGVRAVAADGDDAAAHAAAATSARELSSFLDRHLGIEDDDVLPLFARHFTAAEYQAIDDQALKRIPPRQLLFSIPWAACAGDPATRARLLAEAPLPVRIIWALTRRRYVRRTTLAMGAPAMAVAR